MEKSEIIQENGIVKSGKYLNYTIKNLMELKKEDIEGVTYIRKWDLTNYDKNMLEDYKLFDIEYIYVGHSGEKNFKTRTSKWKHNIKNYPQMVDKEVVRFYNRYKKMMLTEYEMSETDFDNLFFYNSEVELYPFDSIELAQFNETMFLNTYIELWISKKSLSYPTNTFDSDFTVNKNRKIIKADIRGDYFLEMEIVETIQKIFRENVNIIS